MSLRQRKQQQSKLDVLSCFAYAVLGSPILFLASILSSIGEKLVTAVAGWVNGRRFAFGARASLGIVGGI